jgi:hypothetical protein
MTRHMIPLTEWHLVRDACKIVTAELARAGKPAPVASKAKATVLSRQDQIIKAINGGEWGCRFNAVIDLCEALSGIELPRNQLKPKDESNDEGEDHGDNHRFPIKLLTCIVDLSQDEVAEDPRVCYHLNSDNDGYYMIAYGRPGEIQDCGLYMYCNGEADPRYGTPAEIDEFFSTTKPFCAEDAERGFNRLTEDEWGQAVAAARKVMQAQPRPARKAARKSTRKARR